MSDDDDDNGDDFIISSSVFIVPKLYASYISNPQPEGPLEPVHCTAHGHSLISWGDKHTSKDKHSVLLNPPILPELLEFRSVFKSKLLGNVVAELFYYTASQHWALKEDTEDNKHNYSSEIRGTDNNADSSIMNRDTRVTDGTVRFLVDNYSSEARRPLATP